MFQTLPGPGLEPAPTDLWVGHWGPALAPGVCFQKAAPAIVHLLPETHLRPTLSSAAAPVSAVVRAGASDDLGHKPSDIYQPWCNFSLFLKRYSFQLLGFGHPGRRECSGPPWRGAGGRAVKGARWKPTSREVYREYGMNRENSFFRVTEKTKTLVKGDCQLLHFIGNTVTIYC